MKAVLVYLNDDQIIARGPGYIAAAVLESGWELEFFDTAYSPMDRVVRAVLDRRCDLLMLSATSTLYPDAQRLARRVKAACSEIPVLLGGVHCTIAGGQVLTECEAFDYLCIGEGEEFTKDFLARLGTNDLLATPNLAYRGTDGVVTNPVRPCTDLDTLPAPPFHLYDPVSLCRNLPRPGFSYVSATRGCPFSCLRGDTPINTVHGMIPIRELAESKKSIPVYTYSLETRKVFIADAINIRKTGSNRKLVRVHFDDGTHIDCTPDHRFLQFKWGNQFAEGRQWEVEAKDLKVGAHVRALKTYINKRFQRAYVYWGRRSRDFRARLMLEYKLERPMNDEEEVHHKDRNRLNDTLDNLEVTENRSEHAKLHHDESSARMKENNPAKNMTPEWRAKLSEAMTGKIKPPEQRAHYRESKLGKKNPNYKHGRTCGHKSRLEINHRVVGVEHLNEKEDVYCLEVPSTGWFFANNVLVHNCNYCSNSYYLKLYPKSFLRKRKVDLVIPELLYLRDHYPIKLLYFGDEMILFDPEYCTELFQRVHDEVRLPYGCMARVEYINPKTIDLFTRTGGCYVGVGVECGDEPFRKEFLNRHMTNERIIEAFHLLRQVPNMWITSFNMCGYPVPNDAELTRKTEELNAILQPDIMQMSVVFPLPGTKLYDHCVEHDLIDPEKYRVAKDVFAGSVLRGVTARGYARYKR